MSSIIEVRNLCKEYSRGNRKFNALNNINLEIKAGDFVNIIGRSGSGKSTLLNIMAGMLSPTSGKIYFHGGKQGHKVDAIKRHDKVSFCVYDQGFRNPGEWALNIRSVIVFGRIEIVEDTEKVFKISRLLSYKFTDDEEYIEHELVNAGPRTLMFALKPECITGKIVNEA